MHFSNWCSGITGLADDSPSIVHQSGLSGCRQSPKAAPHSTIPAPGRFNTQVARNSNPGCAVDLNPTSCLTRAQSEPRVETWGIGLLVKPGIPFSNEGARTKSCPQRVCQGDPVEGA